MGEDKGAAGPSGAFRDAARRALTPGRVARAAVLSCVYGFVAAAFLPGSMVPDTLDMCQQALDGVYHDWHSPAVAGIWGFAFLAPAQLFLLTWAVTLVSIHLIVARWLRPWVAVVCTSVVVLSPVTLGWLGHIGKDQWFAAAFLLGVALVARADAEQRAKVRRALLAGAGLGFWIAIAARKNAILPVAGALLVAWPVPPTVFGRLGARPMARRVLASGAVALLLGLSVSVFTAVVVQPSARHAEQSTFLFDLSGISLEEQELLVPEGILAPGATLDDVDAFYDVGAGDWFFFGAGTPVNPFMSSPQVERLRQAWLDAVREHPGSYVETRLGYTRALLGWSAPHPQLSINDPGSLPATWNNDCPLGERVAPGLHRTVFDALRWFEVRNVVRSWVLLAALAVAAVLAGLRIVAEARALLVGGVLSLAGLAVVGISPTFRYSWFTALCALIVVALALRRVPGLARSDPPEPDSEPATGPVDQEELR